MYPIRVWALVPSPRTKTPPLACAPVAHGKRRKRIERLAGLFIGPWVYGCFMVSKTEISGFRALLKTTRFQIDLLQKAVERNPYDKESRKRLRKAKTQESVILAKLTEWTLN